MHTPETLQAHVERRFQKWKAEQALDSEFNDALKIAEALTELAADGVTTVAQSRDFDLEGIWERD